jgi:transcriptional regulator with XRE-family HTH domain
MQSGHEQLRDWMRRRGFTQYEAAQYIGWAEASFSKLVNGLRTPGLANAVKIEELTGIPARTWVASAVDNDDEMETVQRGNVNVDGRDKPTARS